MRNLLLRNTIFSSLIVVVPALMPVLLLKELRLDGSSLGLVFASMGVGSVVGAIFVIPSLRLRFATDRLMIIAQITLAGYLSSHGIDSPLPLLPDSDGASWRELDFSTL